MDGGTEALANDRWIIRFLDTGYGRMMRICGLLFVFSGIVQGISLMADRPGQWTRWLFVVGAALWVYHLIRMPSLGVRLQSRSLKVGKQFRTILIPLDAVARADFRQAKGLLGKKPAELVIIGADGTTTRTGVFEANDAPLLRAAANEISALVATGAR